MESSSEQPGSSFDGQNKKMKPVEEVVAPKNALAVSSQNADGEEAAKKSDNHHDDLFFL